MEKKVITITIESEKSTSDSETAIIRTVKIGDKEIFNCTCNTSVYAQEISPLKSFIDWISKVYLKSNH